MTPLNERQEYLLGLLIRSHIETGLPVGSKTLVEHFDLEISSATVRNEMAVLTEAGYLAQLHTSAGRIPTEMGYRYFVQRLIGEFELPLDERQMIRHQFHQARLDLDQWMKLAAAVLARTSQGASIVTAPRPLTNRFKHVQIIATQGRLVLLILVLFGGEVKQQMLTLSEPLPQAHLSACAERLNAVFEDLSAEEIHKRLRLLDDPLEQDITRLVIDIIRRADTRQVSDVYRDGLGNILEEKGARGAVRLLEERTLLDTVLTESLEADAEGVQVVIGGEGRWEELRDCSMILSRYGVEQTLTGAVAVIGPTRMPYARNISAVRYVANLMSGFVSEFYLEPPRQRRQLPDKNQEPQDQDEAGT
jgi:heat-inducible transcriptional repressor